MAGGGAPCPELSSLKAHRAVSFPFSTPRLQARRLCRLSKAEAKDETMQHFRTNPPSRLIPPKGETATTPRSLHAAIIRYMARHPEVTESAFGRQAVNDPAFVSRLRGADEVREETARRVRAFIAEATNA